MHDCDITGGSSGGPILTEVNGEWRIVAVNSAERTQLLTEGGESTSRQVGVMNYAVQISRIVDTLGAQQ